MRFSLSFLVGVVPLAFHLATSIQAAPLLQPQQDLEAIAGREELGARHLTESFADDLLARARKSPPSKPAPPPLNRKQLSQRVQAAQKGQTARKVAVDKKKALNAKTVKNLRKPKTGDPAKMTAQDKKAHAQISSAVSKARKDTKARRTAKWDAKKNTPAKAAANKNAKALRRQERKATGAAPPSPKAPGKKALAKQQRKAATPAERKQVKDAFKDANRRKNNVVNLPGRKDKFTVGGKEFSGKDVRQGAFNAFLHKGNPVGSSENKNPKRFNNRPYSATHPDPALAGKRPIANAGKGQEYPIKSGSHNGYIGSGDVGAGRIVLYKNKKDRQRTSYAVIGHDPARGGDASDHYLATHTKA